MRRPRCESYSPEGYRCRRRAGHEPLHRATGWQGDQEWDDEDAAPQPMQVATWGSIAWSVERLREQCAGLDVVHVDPRDHHLPEAVKASWWRGVDLATPVILVPDVEGDPLLVDGRHRVHKAVVLGRTSLPAYVLDRERERAARLTADERAEFDAMADTRWDATG